MLLLLITAYSLYAAKSDIPDRFAAVAELCAWALARDAVSLDDLISDGLVGPIAPGVFAFIETRIDPLEVAALTRFVRLNGGRALAVGRVLAREIPAVDAVYDPPSGDSRLLTIKVADPRFDNTLGFIKRALGDGNRFHVELTRRTLTKAFEVTALDGGKYVPPHRQRLVDVLIRLFGLDRRPPRPVTLVLDVTGIGTFAPGIRPAGDAYGGSDRSDDLALVNVRGPARPRGQGPAYVNLSARKRNLAADPRLPAMYLMSAGHVLSLTKDEIKITDAPRP